MHIHQELNNVHKPLSQVNKFLPLQNDLATHPPISPLLFVSPSVGHRGQTPHHLTVHLVVYCFSDADSASSMCVVCVCVCKKNQLPATWAVGKGRCAFRERNTHLYTIISLRGTRPLHIFQWYYACSFCSLSHACMHSWFNLQRKHDVFLVT